MKPNLKVPVKRVHHKTGLSGRFYGGEADLTFCMFLWYNGSIRKGGE